MGFENWERGQSNFCESSCFRWLHIVYNFTLRKPSSQSFPSSRNLRCDVGKYLCKDDFLLLALLSVDDCSSQTTWPIHNTRESWEILCICKTCLQHPGIRVMVPSPRYAAPRFVLPRNCCLFTDKDEVNMVSMMIETESWILSRSRPSPPHSLQSIANKNTELYEELSFPSVSRVKRWLTSSC